MKKILTLFLIVPFGLSAQKIALLNTDLKSPIVYTDSVTVEQAGHLFPVNTKDFDTLYANLDYLNKMISVRQRSKMKSFELHAGNVVIKTSRVSFSNGDRYIIKAMSFENNIQSVLTISDAAQSNKKNSKRIQNIMDYLKSNKSLFNKPYGIHPKFYNVVVVTE